MKHAKPSMPQKHLEMIADRAEQLTKALYSADSYVPWVTTGDAWNQYDKACSILDWANARMETE